MSGKVLIINAPNAPYTDESLLIEPIDVLVVASFIRSLGFEITVKDFDREKKTPRLLKDILRSGQYGVVVIPFDYHIPLYTSEAILGVVELVRIAREEGCRVILGGRPCRYSPDVFLSEMDEQVVIADGELEPLLEQLLPLWTWGSEELCTITGVIFFSGGKVVRKPASKRGFDIQRLPIPDRSLLPVEDYIDVRSILSSRGCVEKCSFCPVHRFWGRWRFRKPEQVVQEIRYLCDSFGARKILFLDDHATASMPRMQKISQLLLKDPVQATLGCLGTAHSLDEDTLRLMYAAGFRWIHVGAEYGSDRVLSLMGKRTRAADIRKTVLMAKSIGFRVRTSWILDAPQATYSELQETLALIKELQPHEVRAHYLSIRSGAPLAEDVANMRPTATSQYIHEGYPHNNFSNMCSERIVRAVDELVEELREAGYLAVRNPHDWAVMNNPVNSHPDVRFISFCPGRYGIGWERSYAIEQAA